MELLIIAGLSIAVFLLWDRVSKLKRRIDAHEDWLSDLATRRGVSSKSGEEPDEAVSAPAPQSEAAEPIPASRQVDPVSKAEPEPELEPAASMPLAAPSPALRSEVEEQVEVPAPAPTAEPEPEPEPEDTGPRFDFEDIFGRRLPIWAGGIALAVGGIFLVRYSIEAGLLTPGVRVFLSFLFGLGLIGGAEAAYRLEDRVKDERVRQALAGAGIATLFGAFYLAGSGYGLIGAGAAFVGLAVVTAGAIAMSFRFGLPCAVLGLIGGFAAPVLVDSDSANVPLLALYLSLVAGGLAWTGEKQGRRWLGYAALGLGLGWGLLMQLGGINSGKDFAALGGYLIVLGTVLPAFLHSRGGASPLQIAAAGVATLQMASLVDNAGYDPLTLGLYGLIAAALAALGWRFPPLRAGSAVAAFVGIWLLILWPVPVAQHFAIAAAVFALITAGVPLAHQLRGRAGLLDIAQLGGSAIGIGLAAYVQFGSWDSEPRETMLAISMAALALFPILAFWSRWRTSDEMEIRASLILLSAAHVLSFSALLLVTLAWAAPVVAAAVALPTLALLWKRDALPLLIASWGAIAGTIISLMVTPAFEAELLRLGGGSDVAWRGAELLRWIATAVPLMAMAIMRPTLVSRPIADGLSAVIIYGAIAQLVPGETLAWIAAAAALGLYLWRSDRFAAWGTPLAIAGLWTLEPLAEWIFAGFAAMVGIPFLSDSALGLIDIARQIAPFLGVAGFLAWRGTALPKQVRWAFMAAVGLIGITVVHSIYKQIWGIDSLLRFEHFGMGERSIWQAALVLVGIALMQLPKTTLTRVASSAALCVAFAHFAWFTLLLHNPLANVQHAGPTPIANWLPVAYGAAIAALVLMRGELEELISKARHGVDVAVMALVALLSVSLLRQIFAGSVLTAPPIGQSESLMISLLGIALALGYLWWGSFKSLRSWRIGSLVLMLGAVGKVFLIDAAGLEGLLRIASFLALGFSLIGIGWVYSRQLSRRNTA
ncbi:DUF2339 domain-containing protein [Erythrobacter crassostreae]|uniref:DUF2339 domain-containing protein n=1 Tax=Erythrobacter crassostreae TaxID=2828328 RepID=A0A9X1JMS7_9SPHN|nr:DUF2339 domain-containing protein [Erythrobacter crassostrea]MBV7259043.1 DUF2339 domain-containing protein [Erythrobacter crassostrea]